MGGVWLYCLNNSFRYLNNTTYIFTIFFHLHIFLQHLNVIRTTLPNGGFNSKKIKEKEKKSYGQNLITKLVVVLCYNFAQ